MPSAFRTHECDRTRWTSILETLRNTSVQRVTWFSLWFYFVTSSSLFWGRWDWFQLSITTSVNQQWPRNICFRGSMHELGATSKSCFRCLWLNINSEPRNLCFWEYWLFQNALINVPPLHKQELHNFLLQVHQKFFFCQNCAQKLFKNFHTPVTSFLAVWLLLWQCCCGLYWALIWLIWRRTHLKLYQYYQIRHHCSHHLKIKNK